MGINKVIFNYYNFITKIPIITIFFSIAWWLSNRNLI